MDQGEQFFNLEKINSVNFQEAYENWLVIIDITIACDQ